MLGAIANDPSLFILCMSIAFAIGIPLAVPIYWMRAVQFPNGVPSDEPTGTETTDELPLAA